MEVSVTFLALLVCEGGISRLSVFFMIVRVVVPSCRQA
jgi:hypothetical protein